MNSLSTVVLAALSVCAQHYQGAILPERLFNTGYLSVKCLKTASCSDTWEETQADLYPVGYKKCALIYREIYAQKELIAEKKARAARAKRRAEKKERDAELRRKAADDQPILYAAIHALAAKFH